MTRYLCINENNILKSITDKLYVYKFDPNSSGISTNNNTKLVTIGTNTIKYYSDLPSSMVERSDRTLIELDGIYELKPRIEINGVYYYTKVERSVITPSENEIYQDRSTQKFYLYNSNNSNIDNITVQEGHYESGWIYNTLSSKIDPDPYIAYHDSDLDSYYRYTPEGYSIVNKVSCYIDNNKFYEDEEHTKVIDPLENVPYYNITDSSYYRYTNSSRYSIKCYDGYKDDQKFYDRNNNLYSPEPNCLYHDTSTNRYYIYNGTRYTQQIVVEGYYAFGKFYSDESLITEIEMIEGPIYHDQILNEYFGYIPYIITSLNTITGYLDKGEFYHEGEIAPKEFDNIYIDESLDTLYFYLDGRYLEVNKVNCYVRGNEILSNIPGKAFLYSCIISDEYPEPTYQIMETGEYSIVRTETTIDEYIDLVNKNSLYLYLVKSGNDIDYLQVANIFGMNIKDTTPIHRFNDTTPYGKDCRVLLDEKMQIANLIRALKLRYPGIVFYTDPNDRVNITTHTNEFVYYQAKLFSDDSPYTTPLRYRDSRYGKVRAYDILIYIRYETPDMVTYLNRRNEFLMHDFLSPVNDVIMNLDNGDEIHIGVNWSRAIREEEPDKSVDASERNVYTFMTQCNLNGLLLERSDNPTPIEEVITRIYVTSTTDDLQNIKVGE